MADMAPEAQDPAVVDLPQIAVAVGTGEGGRGAETVLVADRQLLARRHLGLQPDVGGISEVRRADWPARSLSSAPMRRATAI